MRSLSFVLVLIAFVVAVGFLGCQKTETNQPATTSTAVATPTAAVVDHKVTQAEVGTDAVCPVMKTKVKVASDTLAAEYKGKVYYFCCPSCPSAFKADPEKYIAAK